MLPACILHVILHNGTHSVYTLYALAYPSVRGGQNYTFRRNKACNSFLGYLDFIDESIRLFLISKQYSKIDLFWKSIKLLVVYMKAAIFSLYNKKVRIQEKLSKTSNYWSYVGISLKKCQGTYWGFLHFRGANHIPFCSHTGGVIPTGEGGVPPALL